MQTDQLIPRLPRRKKQPTAQQMRAQLAAAADTIASLRAEIDRLRMPWWGRLAAFIRRLRITQKPTKEQQP